LSLYEENAFDSVNNIFSAAKILQFFFWKLLENNYVLYMQNKKDEW